MAKKPALRRNLASEFKPTRNVVPDRIDLRDRAYIPPVSVVPGTMATPLLCVKV